MAQKRAVAAEREGRRAGLAPAARSLSWALPWSLLLALGLLATDAVAQEGDGDSITELSGWAALEVRAFPSAPQNAGQENQRVQPSVAVRPEIRHEWNGGDDRLTLIPFARWDATDGKRSHVDLREANWQHLADNWDLTVGLGKVFWGVTESRHLVDIINQTDEVEDPDGEDKLGQPMINLNLHRDIGSFAFYVLPGFRERIYPGRAGRLRYVFPVDTDATRFESGAKDRHVDLAARWAHSIGDWDIGLSHFHGTSREPRLTPGLDSGGRLILIPTYDIIDQTGLTVQMTTGPWLWKFEGMSRWGHQTDHHFLAAVPGVEYTLYDLFESGKDLGLLLEYQYDGRNNAAPRTAANDDIFVGTRLAFNNTDSTEILLGASVDRHHGAFGIGLEAETRLTDVWTIELEARMTSNVPQTDVLFATRKDDFVQLRLFRYF
ncbi:MAG: hypothetical protein KDE22_02670 [Rhodobacterales bacterium]|nr:hypothetical protein [Rhodobacterales bacterium]